MSAFPRDPMRTRCEANFQPPSSDNEWVLWWWRPPPTWIGVGSRPPLLIHRWAQAAPNLGSRAPTWLLIDANKSWCNVESGERVPIRVRSVLVGGGVGGVQRQHWLCGFPSLLLVERWLLCAGHQWPHSDARVYTYSLQDTWAKRTRKNS
jgi:hypothetical protein